MMQICTGGFHGYMKDSTTSNSPGVVVSMNSSNSTCVDNAQGMQIVHSCRRIYQGSTDPVSGQIIGPASSVSKYDPRIRPWYLAGIASTGGKAWSPPYVFASAPEGVGITAACAVKSAAGQFLGVIGADFRLSTLDSFLEKSATEDDTIFVVDSGGILISTSTPGLSVKASVRVSATECDDALIRAAAIAVESPEVGGWQSISVSYPFAIDVYGKGLYWVNSKEFTDVYGLHWYFVVVEKVACQKGTYTTTASRAQTANQVVVYADSGKICQPCPVGAVCIGGEYLPIPLPDNWVNRSELSLSSSVHACKIASCKGDLRY